MNKPSPPLAEVLDFLHTLYGDATDIHPLAGGFWSQAYGFRTGGRDLVLRLGTIPEGFEADRKAHSYSSDDLPVPKVLDVGTALCWGYAISVKAAGTFLEDTSRDEAALLRPGVGRMLRALRSCQGVPEIGWHDWLLGKLVDDPGARTAGWRHIIAKDPELHALVHDCERRIEELLPHCPQRTDVIHDDLLYRNVLVDRQRITAVFSWKCSVVGDFLFDTAWCTFWSAWHDGVAALDVWGLMSETMPAEDMVDARLRHHCHELVIGAGHLGWYVWTQDEENLTLAASRCREVLDRGPL